jgi:hypothetical protein
MLWTREQGRSLFEVYLLRWLIKEHTNMGFGGGGPGATVVIKYREHMRRELVEAFGVGFLDLSPSA